jgi:hypothetical protein
MLTPAELTILAYPTGTFEVTLELFKDKAHTEKYPLTGYTTTMFIEGFTTLKAGAGLTINEAEGKVTVVLTPAQTTTVTPGEIRHYYLQLEKAGEVVFPLSGGIKFVAP